MRVLFSGLPVLAKAPNVLPQKFFAAQALGTDRVTFSHKPALTFGATDEKRDAAIVGMMAPILSATGNLAGTAGIRSEYFTAAQLTKINDGVIRYLKANTTPGQKPTVILGKDTRWFSRDNMKDTVEQFKQAGVNVIEIKGYASTPITSYAIRHAEKIIGKNNLKGQQLHFAYLLTASHNPYRHGGLKILNGSGVNLEDNTWRDIESYIYDPNKGSTPQAGSIGEHTTIDFTTSYFNTALKMENKAILPSKAKVLPFVADGHYGTSESFWHWLTYQLVDNGKSKVTVTERSTEQEIQNMSKKYNRASEPIMPYLDKMLEKLEETPNAKFSVANDGDSDRAGLAMKNPAGKASVVNINDMMAVALYGLHKMGLSGDIVRNHATTNYLTDLTRALNEQLPTAKQVTVNEHVTPVGFKNLGEKLNQLGNQALFAVEGSGGATSGKHAVYEKDGHWLAAVIIRAMSEASKDPAVLGKSKEFHPELLINYLRDKTPTKYAFRELKLDIPKLIDAKNPPAKDDDRVIRATDTFKKAFEKLANAETPVAQGAISDKAASAEHNEQFKDGTFIQLKVDGQDSNSFVLLRSSGTEPVLRLYMQGADASNREKAIDLVNKITDTMLALAQEATGNTADLVMDKDKLALLTQTADF